MSYLIVDFLANPIAQSVGLLAFVCSAFAASQKDEVKLRNYMAASAFVWVAHHYLLHSYTASILLFFIAIRCYMSAIFIDKALKIRVFITIFFVALNALISYYTWEGYHSLFAFTAATVATFAVLLTKGFWTRILLISVELLWLAYNIKVGSIGGIVACLTDGGIMCYVLFSSFMKERAATEVETALSPVN